MRQVAGAHPIGAEKFICLDDAGARTCDVVFIGIEQTGVFRGLTSDECAPGDLATARDARDDRRNAFGHDLAGGDVIGHEQRLGPADHEIVDDHSDQVETDRVVDVHPLCHSDFRAHPIGGCGQQRAAVMRQCGYIEQAGESTEVTDDLRPGGTGDRFTHEGDRAFTGLDIDTGSA